MRAYLDTSVVLRLVRRAPDRLREWGRWERAYSSELLEVETLRALDRLRLLRAYTDEILAAAHAAASQLVDQVELIALSRPVLQSAARPMPTVVGTLDALHLASALELRDHLEQPVTFVTHDLQQANAATALGFEVIGRPAS